MIYRFCVSLLVMITGLFSFAATLSADPALQYETLRAHIADVEEVDLNIYVIGFDGVSHADVKTAIGDRLQAARIYDTKPWWIPRIPIYEDKTGAQDFATVPAPQGLPPELTPPDGMIRYEPNSLTPDATTLPPFMLWQPNNGIELEDLVSDWLENNDVVNNMEHAGSLRDVPFEIDKLKFKFLPGPTLDSLYSLLEANTQTLDLDNPDLTYTLYSYNDLMQWLDNLPQIKQPQGGAVMVVLNLERFANQNYAFYAEPDKDVIPVPGQAPSTRQYQPVVVPDPALQATANLFTDALGGIGLDHSKMMSALELECATTSTAAAEGLVGVIENIQPTQSVCAEWRSAPIRNLLGNNGRRIFVNDATQLLSTLPTSSALASVSEDMFHLYRYGVLAQSIKGIHEYSEAQELRTLVVDLRYDNMDLCILDQLGQGNDAVTAITNCAAQAPAYPTEKSYTVEDVFDVDLALKSLAEFAPGRWFSTLVPFDFSNLPDPVTIAVTKKTLRDLLDKPVVDLDPGPGEIPYELKHFPFYRSLTLEDRDGQLVELESRFEKSLDFQVTTALLLNDAPTGLGVYDLVWPDAIQVDERPYRETGKPFVHVSFLYLTPPPDGPTGEKWGTFSVDLEAFQLVGTNTEFGGGGWWASVAGNEMTGGVARRDFSLTTPQYILGKNRGAGQAQPWGVSPDGVVQPGGGAEATFEKRIDGGAPHWCEEFNSADANLRQTCRDFVRTTTTLQTIETIQHGLGYAHSHEPRIRYHFDGQVGTQQRANELFIESVYGAFGAPVDEVGRALHQMVNMYTTLGVSSLWGQSTSDWNGVGPHAGMQSTLLRSHVREEALGLEAELDYAIALWETNYEKSIETGESSGKTIEKLLKDAIKRQGDMKTKYDEWAYKKALYSALEALSLVDQALTLMGEADRIHDPITELGLTPFE